MAKVKVSQAEAIDRVQDIYKAAINDLRRAISGNDYLGIEFAFERLRAVEELRRYVHDPNKLELKPEFRCNLVSSASGDD